jgi:hypothetical protein
VAPTGKPTEYKQGRSPLPSRYIVDPRERLLNEPFEVVVQAIAGVGDEFACPTALVTCGRRYYISWSILCVNPIHAWHRHSSGFRRRMRNHQVTRSHAALKKVDQQGTQRSVMDAVVFMVEAVSVEKQVWGVFI